MKIGDGKGRQRLRRHDGKPGSDGTHRLGGGLSRATGTRAGRTAGTILVARRRTLGRARDFPMAHAQRLSQNRRRLSRQQQKKHNAGHAPKEHARRTRLRQGGAEHRESCPQSLAHPCWSSEPAISPLGGWGLSLAHVADSLELVPFRRVIGYASLEKGMNLGPVGFEREATHLSIVGAWLASLQ